MDLSSKILELAKKNQAKIGIGTDDSIDIQRIIEKSAAAATDQGLAEVTIFRSPRELVAALNSGGISGAVRGALPAKETIGELKKVSRVTSIYRSAFISLDEKHCFFLAPVGIDEGIFIDERLQLIKQTDSLLKRLGVTSKTGIISGGRLPDDYGRSGLVDESLKAGEKLFKLTQEAGLDVKHYGILIEEAYKNSNIIVAPNGIVGNLLFRTLHLMGNCRSFGAPVLNLDKVFIDTSRSKQDYTDSIILASALSGL